jgi:hypothetical protein
MRKVILFLLLMPLFMMGQSNKDMVNLCAGNAALGNELFSIYPTQLISVYNNSTNKKNYVTGVVMSDSKTGYTVLTVKYTDSYSVSFGYAPGLDSKNNFNDKGEYCMYMNSGGEITQLYNFTTPLKKTTYDGKQVESLKHLNMEVLISEKLEVICFILADKAYILPKGYFDYK